jgi:superfamily II DNA helicase RecQ
MISGWLTMYWVIEEGISDLTTYSPLQRDVIVAVIEGHDVFLQASTSFGKSLCYQLPAVLKDWGCEYCILYHSAHQRHQTVN